MHGRVPRRNRSPVPTAGQRGASSRLSAKIPPRVIGARAPPESARHGSQCLHETSGGGRSMRPTLIIGLLAVALASGSACACHDDPPRLELTPTELKLPDGRALQVQRG